MSLTTLALFWTVNDEYDLEYSDPTFRPRSAEKLRGLMERHSSADQVARIRQFEDKYDEYVETGSRDFGGAVNECLDLYAKDARKVAKSCGVNLAYGDWYAELAVKAWETVLKYKDKPSHYFLLEQVKTACKSRRRDIVRHHRAQKRDVTLTCSLDDGKRHESFAAAMRSDPSSGVGFRDLKQRMMEHESLTDDERRLLRYLFDTLYDYPISKDNRLAHAIWGPSYQRMADDLGLGHKQRAKRLRQSLARKLKCYEKYLRSPYV